MILGAWAILGAGAAGGSYRRVVLRRDAAGTDRGAVVPGCETGSGPAPALMVRGLDPIWVFEIAYTGGFVHRSGRRNKTLRAGLACCSRLGASDPAVRVGGAVGAQGAAALIIKFPGRTLEAHLAARSWLVVSRGAVLAGVGIGRLARCGSGFRLLALGAAGARRLARRRLEAAGGA